MKNIFITLSLCFIGILFSCNNKKSSSTLQAKELVDTPYVEPAFTEIDLASNMTNNGERLSASHFLKPEAEYIKLETNNKCLISNSYRTAVGKKYIIIGDGRTGEVFVFNRKGKYIRTFCKNGKGPGEVTIMGEIAIVEDTLAYLSSHYRRGLYVYNINNGKYLKTIPMSFNGGVTNLEVLNRNRITFSYGVGFKFYEYVIVYTQDEKNNIVAKKIKRFKFKEPYLDAPMDFHYKGLRNVYSRSNDTIYAVTADSIYPRYHLNLGKYRRDVIDIKDPRRRMKEFYVNSLYLDGINENKDKLYIYGEYNLKFYSFVYHKRTKKLTCRIDEPTRVEAGIGIYNDNLIKRDLDGYVSFIYKSREDEVIHIIGPDKIEKAKKFLAENTDVKLPEKRKELLRLVNEMDEEDNPLILVYKAKE